jgi:hypothetical protein
MKPLAYSKLYFLGVYRVSKAIKLSEELINDAVTNGIAQHRSAPKQIEYWARIGKIADENPDLPLSFIKGVLVGIEESRAGDVSEYKFG